MSLHPALLLALCSVAFGAQLSEEECRNPPKNWPQVPPVCCGTEELPYPTDEMKQIFGRCVETVVGPPEKQGNQEEDPRLCIEECVYKNLGFLKKDGKSLASDVVNSRSGRKISSQWSPAMQAAINACATVRGYDGPSAPKCNTLPHDHTHCVSRQLYLNCPKKLWNDSAECKIVKKRMEECPGLPPPPPSQPQGAQGS